MALDRHIARLAKILVDSENISFDEAQARLRALTLEIVVAPEATSPAAHAAILTAVSVASRTFVGGVSVAGAIDQPLNSTLPLKAGNLTEAAILAGASVFDGHPSRKIFVGTNGVPAEAWSVSPWWSGWSAGTAKPGEARWDAGDNPLPGIAAGALAVGAAFDAERGCCDYLGVEGQPLACQARRDSATLLEGVPARGALAYRLGQLGTSLPLDACGIALRRPRWSLPRPSGLRQDY